VHVDRVEKGAPDVVLMLVEGTVPDPHRPGAFVTGEVVEGALGQVVLAADPVHDLQVFVLGFFDPVSNETHECPCFAIEAQRVERPEGEGRVADPAVAVVPVAFPTRGLGQRGGGSGKDRPGRLVDQSFEDQGRALQVAPPGVVGELALDQPLAPVLLGRVDPFDRFGGAARVRFDAFAPGQGAEGPVALFEVDRADRLPGAHVEVEVGGEEELGAAPVTFGRRLAEFAGGPDRGILAVAEPRVADHLEIDFAFDAFGHAHQGQVGFVVDPFVFVAFAGIAPFGDRQGVPDDHPAGVGGPGRLEDQRARLVTPTEWGHRPFGREPELAGGAVEDCTEDRWRVETRHAQPFDRTIWSDECGRVAIRQEAVAADRRERRAFQTRPSASYSRRKPSNRRRWPCSSRRIAMTMSWVTGSTVSVASMIFS